MTKPTSAESSIGGIEPAVALELSSLVDFAEGSVVSRTVAKGSGGTLTLFAFDHGEGLSEHSAPFDAYILVLEGDVSLTVGDRGVVASAGDLVRLPANVPHALRAESRLKMLLVMLKDPTAQAKTAS